MPLQWALARLLSPNVYVTRDAWPEWKYIRLTESGVLVVVGLAGESDWCPTYKDMTATDWRV